VSLPRIAVSIGDPAGVGAEIILSSPPSMERLRSDTFARLQRCASPEKRTPW